MNLLALDTSSIACSLALQVDGHVFEAHAEEPREHTRLLMPMIRRLLADAETAIAELDGIVLGNGPGSFIGMRIATSVAQGLALGAGLKIAPLSSLAAVAAETVANGAEAVAVAQDAHMREVYLGLYEVRAGALRPLIDERIQGGVVIEELADRADFVAAGAGWHGLPELLEANRNQLFGVGECLHPRARYLLEPGALAFSGGDAIAPELLVPAYLRHKVAEKPKESAL